MEPILIEAHRMHKAMKLAKEIGFAKTGAYSVCELRTGPTGTWLYATDGKCALRYKVAFQPREETTAYLTKNTALSVEKALKGVPGFLTWDRDAECLNAPCLDSLGLVLVRGPVTGFPDMRNFFDQGATEGEQIPLCSGYLATIAKCFGIANDGVDVSIRWGNSVVQGNALLFTAPGDSRNFEMLLVKRQDGAEDTRKPWRDLGRVVNDAAALTPAFDLLALTRALQKVELAQALLVGADDSLCERRAYLTDQIKALCGQ